MPRSLSLHHGHDLPDDVLLSVRGVSRAVGPGVPQAPRWLARVLPKSGLAGAGAWSPEFADDEVDDEEEDDLVDDLGGEDEEPSVLKEISFDLRRGEGIGILGNDQKARRTLFRILTGAVPPSSGMALVRGRVAPVLKNDLMKLTGAETGKQAVFVVARFLQWRRSHLRKRWDEILEFARLDELSDLEPGKHRYATTTRLLLSAALHLDAEVYLIDESFHRDRSFAERCLDMLEQRQQEGAAVIQGGWLMIENLARLCNEVLWLEDGGIAYRGRPVDVAIAVEKGRKEELHPLAVPVSASLDDSGPVEVDSVGATVDLELHVLRKGLNMTFTLQLTDSNGDETQFEQPESVRSDDPGLYRLRISIPGGLLADGTYEAKLLAEVGVRGSKPAPPRELLTFEIVSTGHDEAEAGREGLGFELLFDEVEETPADVERIVSRSPS